MSAQGRHYVEADGGRSALKCQRVAVVGYGNPGR
jgi:hypothetical protein